MSSMYQCRFCTSERPGREIVAREMLFGYRDEFDYVECSRCGSLQIKEVPADLSKYYPQDYYSFSVQRDAVLKRWVKKRRFQAVYGEGGLLGRLVVGLWGKPPLASWLKPTGAAFDDAILDVGSGSGDLLLQLHDVGFTNLIGVDPFLTHDKTLVDGVCVLKRELREVDGRYDLIMFNHSLEHVPRPEEELRAAARLLETGKHVVVRLPLAGSYAWRTYGADWVQLDAPRHLCVPTEEGMRSLADRTGYEVDDVLYESRSFQFWGSEQYRRDIPHMDERSYRQHPKRSLFSVEDIRAFQRRAEELNQAGDGDEACFFLRKR